MGKSLTEVAKAILMNESNDSAPDRDAKSSNPNMATLKPKSKVSEPDPKSNEATLVADAPKKPGEGDNVGAKAATMKQDNSQASPSRKGAVPAMPMQKEVMEEDLELEDEVLEEAKMKEKEEDEKEEMDEEMEISEELQAFIDEMIEEGYDEDQIVAAIEENFEFVSEEVEQIDEAKVPDSHKKAMLKTYGAGRVTISDGQIHHKDKYGETNSHKYDPSKNQPIGRHVGTITVQMEEAAPVEYDYEVDMNEHVQALFAGEDLSEEFMSKAVTIFEAAVKSKMQSEIARLEEAYAATLEEEVETIKEELSNNVDDYLNYVVEQWVSDNEVAIEAGLRSELTEDFISGLRQLFAEHYIDIPEDKISVVEELGSKVEELESKLNEEIERNVELTKILSESTRDSIMHSMVEGLTATQAEKLKSLAENVDFVDADSYATKIQTLRESYFPSSVKPQTELDRIEAGTEGQTMIAEENNPMSKYVRALGKSLPN